MSFSADLGKVAVGIYLASEESSVIIIGSEVVMDAGIRRNKDGFWRAS